MKVWAISYGMKECRLELVDSKHAQPYPELILRLDGKKFFVEFENRSDYWMAAFSQT